MCTNAANSVGMNPSTATSISELNRRSSIRLVVAEEEPENTSTSSGGINSTIPKDSVNGRSIRGNWVAHTWGRRDGA